MPPVIDPDDDIPEDEDEDFEVEEEIAEGEHCPICDSPEGECEHLLAAIDRTYSEIESGAIFAHERTVLDMIERLVAQGPDALKTAGAGHALVQAATLVEADVEGGMSMGDAVSTNFPHLIEALCSTLEEDGDVTVTEGEVNEGTDESWSYVNLWTEDAEGAVERLIDRLQGLLDELE